MPSLPIGDVGDRQDGVHSLSSPIPATSVIAMSKAVNRGGRWLKMSHKRVS